MPDLNDYLKWKKRLEELKREESKLEGAMEHTQTQLTEQFGCTSIDQAEKQLIKKQKEAEQADAAATVALEKLERDWGDKL